MFEVLPSVFERSKLRIALSTSKACLPPRQMQDQVSGAGQREEGREAQVGPYRETCDMPVRRQVRAVATVARDPPSALWISP